jgi:tRNA-dihydrouridine synthase
MITENLPKPFFILAPMDDVTDVVFRQIVANCAAPDLFMTEFVNVDGLQSPGREKLLPKLLLGPKEGTKNGGLPIIAQIWGKHPENYYKTVKDLITMGYDGVDLNMGCPDKSVVKNGCCSALIDNRELAEQIITSVREAAGDHFPISVKTRLGLKEIDLSWHEFLLGQKLNMLTIHGRTQKEMSKVPVHWDEINQIRKLRDRLSHNTLIVGNGDIKTKQEGQELAKKYKLDGIMIGRGIFDDPFLFSNPKSPWESYTKHQKMDLYRQHVELFAKTWTNNERKLHTLNKFCKVYIQGFDGAKELRERLMNAQSIEELLAQLNESA